ncbi:hypothetical protein GDO86_019907 [Hymenochirus boettgeri]|uniref:Myb/SANT-like DNA-binding domain-containing protein n=1 Tax=Hymenochirus boettgeri TaxID=247094 RepID=A0A8T2III5_9PIPI|nr:hypothetical protein GDO86_019907 [Hymenochirus boettgeri]
MGTDRMEQEILMDTPGRRWTLHETQTLLDLIWDMRLGPALTRKGYQNWDVFERLRVLLKRSSVRASSGEIKAQWQALKIKFWRLKRFANANPAPLAAITADFPFYKEMEQLLIPEKRSEICKREADSTSQDNVLPSTSFAESGLLSDDDMTDDGSMQEMPFDQEQFRQNINNQDPRDAPEGGAVARNEEQVAGGLAELEIGQSRQLQTTMERLVGGITQLVQSMERLCAVQEQLSIQLGYAYSIGGPVPCLNEKSGGRLHSQQMGKARENTLVVQGTRNSRVVRRSLRMKKPTVRYYP